MNSSRHSLVPTFLLVVGLALSACGSKAAPSGLEIRARYDFGTHSQTDYLLLPGNRIFRGIPIGGLDHFDFDKARAEHPKECGTYTLTNDQMTISWGGGEAPVTWKHTTSGNEEQMDGAAWMKCEPCKSGQRLDGRYAFSAGTAGVSIYRELNFHPDGTYSRQLVGATRTEAGGGHSQKDEIGTYGFNGYTLTLKASDGKTTPYTFFVEVEGADAAKPETVVFDGQKMNRARQ